MASLLGIGKKGKLVDTTQGYIGNAVQGLGIGTVWNVADKKFFNGKMTAMGVSIGQTLNAKPLCLNVTDALTYASVVGLSLKFDTKHLIAGAIAVGVKKVFEAFDYIDPPVNTPSGQTTTAINYPSMTSSAPTSSLFVGGRF